MCLALPTNHSCTLGLITAIVCAKLPPTPIILLFKWMGYFAYRKECGDINCSQVFCGQDMVRVCVFCQGQRNGNGDKHHPLNGKDMALPKVPCVTLTLTASFKELLMLSKYRSSGLA